MFRELVQSDLRITPVSFFSLTEYKEGGEGWRGGSLVKENTGTVTSIAHSMCCICGHLTTSYEWNNERWTFVYMPYFIFNLVMKI